MTVQTTSSATSAGQPSSTSPAPRVPGIPLRWLASLVVAVLIAQLAHLLITNHHFDWRVVGTT